MTTCPVRTSTAGDWFLPSDGGAGSLLRVSAGAVRRIRDLGLPGLLPIGNVVAENGQVWLRTPQPPGPALDDLLAAPLTRTDAVVVLAVVMGLLADLHAIGLIHGSLDGAAVLLDPDGAPLVVAVSAGPGDRAQDVTDVAGLAWVLAASWCAGDPCGAGLLRRCGNLAESVGLAAALAALPPDNGSPEGRRHAAWAWSDRLVTVPAPRAAGDGRRALTVRP